METEEQTKKTIPELSVDAQTLARYLQTVPQGTTVKYAELNALIKADVQNGASGALRTARKVTQRDHSIVFDTIRNVGIRRLVDNEFAKSGRADVTKIHRTARRGAKKMACADFAKLTNEERIEFNATSSMLGALYLVSKEKNLKALEDKAQKAQDKISLNETLELFKK